MKKLIPTFILLFFSFIVSGQQSYNYIAKDVTKMAVFPGCEKFSANKDLQSCIAKKINEEIGIILDPQADYFINFRMKEITSKIQFVITKKGEIININHIEGNQLLSQKAISAFENYAKEINVQPASIEDGTLVNLVFQLPLKYRLNLIWEKELEIFKESGAQELAYLTLNENDETYEIRLKNDLTFSIYKINNDKIEFLGNVMNWMELNNMEPFANYVNQLSEKKWELITERELDGESFRIYRWGYDLEYVRVYKLVNGKEELVLQSNRFKKFKKSPYLKLLFRN